VRLEHPADTFDMAAPKTLNRHREIRENIKAEQGSSESEEGAYLFNLVS
jgi:hypothetical protein